MRIRRSVVSEYRIKHGATEGVPCISFRLDVHRAAVQASVAAYICCVILVWSDHEFHVSGKSASELLHLATGAIASQPTVRFHLWMQTLELFLRALQWWLSCNGNCHATIHAPRDLRDLSCALWCVAIVFAARKAHIQPCQALP